MKDRFSKTRLKKVYKLSDSFIKTYRGYELYPYQKEGRNAIFDSVLNTRGWNIAMEVSRQSGKTTGIADSIASLSTFVKDLMPHLTFFSTGFYALRKEQVLTDYESIRTLLIASKNDMNIEFLQSNTITHKFTTQEELLKSEETGRPPWYASLLCQSGGKTTNLESKTHHLVVIEEAHKFDDNKYFNEIRPMLTATFGTKVHVGVAGTQVCYFHKLIEEEEADVVIKLDIDRVIEEKLQAYEKDGNEFHLNYIKDWEKLIKHKPDKGINDPWIRLNYYLLWDLETGMFVTRRKYLEACKTWLGWIHSKQELLDEIKRNGRLFYGLEQFEGEIVLGQDNGKMNDSTVVSITWHLPPTKKHPLGRKRLLNRFELHGDDYGDQFRSLKPLLEPYEPDWHFIDSTIHVPLDKYGKPKDPTNHGDRITEEWMKGVNWRVIPYNFAQPRKHLLYQNAMTVWNDNLLLMPGSEKAKNTDIFLKGLNQWADLIKDYAGVGNQWLSPHHPALPNAHDDFCDADALSFMNLRAKGSVTFA